MHYCLARRSLIYNINSIINTRISDNPNNGINSPNTIKHMMSDIDAGFFTRCGTFTAVFFVRFIQETNPIPMATNKAIHTNKLMILFTIPNK